tara:strand:- start:35 stop:145 length:111 start_codon:yes stop_codon:yes gene_type:complete
MEGQIKHYETIQEKEKVCLEMVGYNESLKEKNKGDK